MCKLFNPKKRDHAMGGTDIEGKNFLTTLLIESSLGEFSSFPRNTVLRLSDF